MYICDKTIPKTKSKPRKTRPPFRGKPFEQISCLKSGNTIITDDKAKADALVTHYDNMLSSDKSTLRAGATLDKGWGGG